MPEGESFNWTLLGCFPTLKYFNILHSVLCYCHCYCLCSCLNPSTTIQGENNKCEPNIIKYFYYMCMYMYIQEEERRDDIVRVRSRVFESSSHKESKKLPKIVMIISHVNMIPTHKWCVFSQARIIHIAYIIENRKHFHTNKMENFKYIDFSLLIRLVPEEENNGMFRGELNVFNIFGAAKGYIKC